MHGCSPRGTLLSRRCPSDLLYLLKDTGAVRLDVERARDGAILGSVPVPHGLLELQVDRESPMYIMALQPDRQIIPYCGTGGRSALAAKSLLDMGYEEYLLACRRLRRLARRTGRVSQSARAKRRP